jgi:hypothetical protein
MNSVSLPSFLRLARFCNITKYTFSGMFFSRPQSLIIFFHVRSLYCLLVSAVPLSLVMQALPGFKAYSPLDLLHSCLQILTLYRIQLGYQILPFFPCLAVMAPTSLLAVGLIMVGR